MLELVRRSTGLTNWVLVAMKDDMSARVGCSRKVCSPRFFVLRQTMEDGQRRRKIKGREGPQLKRRKNIHKESLSTNRLSPTVIKQPGAQGCKYGLGPGPALLTQT